MTFDRAHLGPVIVPLLAHGADPGAGGMPAINPLAWWYMMRMYPGDPAYANVDDKPREWMTVRVSK